MKRSFGQMDDPSSPSSSIATNTETALFETGKHKTKAIDVENDIRTELGKSVYNSTDGFIESLLDVPQTLVDAVYDACVASAAGRDSLYVCNARGHGRWRGYPTKLPSKESPLYKPFVEIASEVTEISRELAIQWGEPVNNVRWLDQHSHVPPKAQSYAADLRPDIVVTIGNCPGDGSVAPWRRIVAPLEVKKDYNDKPALLQLLMYQRQLFREAVDRRFVLGFTLAYKRMKVYVADRSGVLGSKVFDVNTDPKMLIRVIAAMETLPLHRLGWDTTMRALVKNQATNNVNPQSLPFSYGLPYQGHAMDHYFVIDMPLPRPKSSTPVSTSDTRSQYFVLYESLSLKRGEYIVGRATRVWKAWLWDDMPLPKEKRPVYIVKDTWRDAARGLEGELYEKLEGCKGIAIMHSYGVVRIDGCADKTLSFIRRGLSTCGEHLRVDAQQKETLEDAVAAVTNKSPEERLSTTRYVIDEGDYLPEEPGGRLPRERVHSRLVMKTYGWPAKNAQSPLELAIVFRDAIRGHFEAYKKNVLHRDISPENILILIDGSGVLIDLDNAILRSAYEALIDDPLTGTLPFMSAELLGRRPYYRPRTSNLGPPVHDFIHDLESFLWVLVWICLSRDGPARRRRDLMSIEHSERLFQLRSSFRTLFEGDPTALATGKRFLIISAHQRDVIEEEILQWVPEFLSPLNDLIYDLLVTINIAYASHRTRSDFVYGEVLSLFDKHIKGLRTGPPLPQDFESLRQEEMERRKRDVGTTWDPSPKVIKTATAQPQSEEEVDATYDPSLSPTPQPKRLRLLEPLHSPPNDQKPYPETSSSSSSSKRSLTG